MFSELTEELLDFTATEKGYGDAVYAQNDGGDTCSGISLCTSVVLCCIHICWSAA